MIIKVCQKQEKNIFLDIFGIPRSIFRKFWKKFWKFWKKFWNFFFQVGCLFPLNWRWGIQILKKFLKKIIFSDFSTYSRLFLAFFTWKSQISTWSRAQNKKCHWKMLFRMAHRTWKCKKTGGRGGIQPPPQAVTSVKYLRPERGKMVIFTGFARPLNVGIFTPFFSYRL